jgi:hypothetical protein
MEGYTDTSLIVSSLFYNFEEPDNPNHYSSDGSSYFSFETTRFVSPRIGPWAANFGTAPAAVMNVIKSNYSNIYKFNGTVKDSSGNIIAITDGRYRADHSREVNND